MTLLFGNLTQQLVDFTIILNKAKSGDPTAIAAIPATTAAFRKVVAEGATDLVYIGASLAPFVHGQSSTIYVPRYRNARLHIHLYVWLGPHS